MSVPLKRRKRDERPVRRILRLPEVKRKVGLGHAVIYEAITKGTFPKPVPIGAKAVGWLEDEINAWIEARIADRDSGTVVRALPLAGANPERRRIAPAKPRHPSPSRQQDI